MGITASGNMESVKYDSRNWDPTKGTYTIKKNGMTYNAPTEHSFPWLPIGIKYQMSFTTIGNSNLIWEGVLERTEEGNLTIVAPFKIVIEDGFFKAKNGLRTSRVVFAKKCDIDFNCRMIRCHYMSHEDRLDWFAVQSFTVIHMEKGEIFFDISNLKRYKKDLVFTKSLYNL